MHTDVRMIQLLMELRRQGVTDSDVLSAMELTPREDFVPDVFLSRIPAGSDAEMDLFVTKATQYENFQSTDTWRGRQLLVSDDEAMPPFHHVEDRTNDRRILAEGVDARRQRKDGMDG